MRRTEELLEKMLHTMERGFSSLHETMEHGFSRIDRRLASIENALGIPAEGRGREALIEWLKARGEKVERIQESTKKKGPDAVVYTDRAVYVLEAKNQIVGNRAKDVLNQVQRHVEDLKERLKGRLKGKKVMPVVYAWKMDRKAIRKLEKSGVMVLYEGKDTLEA